MTEFKTNYITVMVLIGNNSSTYIGLFMARFILEVKHQPQQDLQTYVTFQM